MISAKRKIEARARRRKRVRKKVKGTAERPRLSVFRSLRHIYAQVIVDTTGQTLTSASTLNKEIRVTLKQTGNNEAAKKVGELIARRSIDKGITEVIFDRDGYLFHGRVKALAEAAREYGLIF